jgi:Domain of Unknown Function (DUF928)
MFKLKSYTHTLKFLTLVLISTSCGSFSQAESATQNIQTPGLIIASVKYVPPPPPPAPPGRGGEPLGRGGGGAGRGCAPTALVPVTLDKNGNYHWGQTVSARPQFWYALPKQVTKRDTLEFVLKDNQGKQIYQTKLKTEAPKGIINFTLPAIVPELEIGKLYTWSFMVYCDADAFVDKAGSVQGTIQRVTISTKLQNQLTGAKSPVSQASIYAQNGLWFDALSTLAVNMHAQKANDIDLAWNDLLTQAKLEKVAKLPVTNCCKAR